MEQQTGPRLGTEHVKVVYCHPAYLNSMQSTSCEMPGWMNHKVESRLLAEVSTSDIPTADDTTLTAESEEELKSLLIMVKDENEKAG